MVIAMKKDALTSQVAGVIALLKGRGIEPRMVTTDPRTVLGVVDELDRALAKELMNELADLPGVDEISSFTDSWKLVSRSFREDTTQIKLGPATIGGGDLMIMAGPCAVESRENYLPLARELNTYGATVLRGGAFKPRTSPYSFRGLGEEGLKIMAEARAETGLPIITEVLTPADVELVADYADALQVGTRNMQNFTLLEAVGDVNKPVLLKRGLMATIKELLLSAEYIVARGNNNVMLCERGIRTFETQTRNTLDISAVPVLKKHTHLPVVVDPSHAAGKRELVPSLAMAAVAAGADGLMLEVHQNPEAALSDGRQSLAVDAFSQLMAGLAKVAFAVNRRIVGVDHEAQGNLFAAGG
jgi:3-deoxy-7-phosphoheptulonate synthase